MKNALVINTSPTLALTAALTAELGGLELLAQLYERIIFSETVAAEIRDAGRHGFGVAAFERAAQNGAPFEIMRLTQPIAPWLLASLDAGEASVIALAQQINTPLVCIDELAGRRIARLNNLQVTGSWVFCSS